MTSSTTTMILLASEMMSKILRDHHGYNIESTDGLNVILTNGKTYSWKSALPDEAPYVLGKRHSKNIMLVMLIGDMRVNDSIDILNGWISSILIWGHRLQQIGSKCDPDSYDIKSGSLDHMVYEHSNKACTVLHNFFDTFQTDNVINTISEYFSHVNNVIDRISYQCLNCQYNILCNFLERVGLELPIIKRNPELTEKIRQRSAQRQCAARSEIDELKEELERKYDVTIFDIPGKSESFWVTFSGFLA